jgi:hypothetical protein
VSSTPYAQGREQHGRRTPDFAEVHSLHAILAVDPVSVAKIFGVAALERDMQPLVGSG